GGDFDVSPGCVEDSTVQFLEVLADRRLKRKTGLGGGKELVGSLLVHTEDGRLVVPFEGSRRHGGVGGQMREIGSGSIHCRGLGTHPDRNGKGRFGNEILKTLVSLGIEHSARIE